MNRLHKNILPLFFIFLSISTIASYNLFFREEITFILDGKVSNWSTVIINWIYPRFYVEQYRFPSEFFLAKTELVFYRGVSVLTIFGAFSFALINNHWFTRKWNNFWDQKIDHRNIHILNRIYIMFVLFFTKDLYWDIIDLQTAAIYFYQPVFLLNLLGLGFPSVLATILLLLTFYITLGLAFFNKSRKWTFCIAICLFVYFEALLNGFQKIDHGFASFFYTGFGIALSNFITNTLQEKAGKWPILLTQLWVTLCYFFAALEKLTISGVNWFFSTHSIKSHLIALPTPFGLFISDYDWICTVILYITMITQFGFITILFNKKLILPILIMGTFFHWGTTFFLGINQVINPWIAAYIIFIDWTKLSLLKKKSKINCLSV